jgi:hypothetical protein
MVLLVQYARCAAQNRALNYHLKLTTLDIVLAVVAHSTLVLTDNFDGYSLFIDSFCSILPSFPNFPYVFSLP